MTLSQSTFLPEEVPHLWESSLTRNSHKPMQEQVPQIPMCQSKSAMTLNPLAVKASLFPLPSCLSHSGVTLQSHTYPVAASGDTASM